METLRSKAPAVGPRAGAQLTPELPSSPCPVSEATLKRSRRRSENSTDQRFQRPGLLFTAVSHYTSVFPGEERGAGGIGKPEQWS